MLDKIKMLDNNEVRVLPAIMVIKNSFFHRLFDITNYVYNSIGMLPSFSELTYHAFEFPTDVEINDLYENVKLIAKQYYGKAAIRIFPYVSPELYANNQKNYLTELDLENTISISSNNIDEVANNLYRKLHDSYIPNLIHAKIQNAIGLTIVEL